MAAIFVSVTDDAPDGTLQAPIDMAEVEATFDDLFAPVEVDDRQLELDLFDYDAEADDYEACPEMYFLSRGQQCEYCKGYEKVAGPTLTTGQFLGAN